MKPEREKLPSRFLRRMTASYRKGGRSSSQSNLRSESVMSEDVPTLSTSSPMAEKAEPQAPGQNPTAPPAVPARTTSRLSQDMPPLASSPPRPRQSVDRGSSRQISTSAAAAHVPAEARTNGHGKLSDFEIIEADDDNPDDDDSDSAVSVDDKDLPPLPPLPEFNGTPSDRDIRRRDSSQIEVGEGAEEKDAGRKPNPRPPPGGPRPEGPHTIKQSRVIDIPVQKDASAETVSARKSSAARASSGQGSKQNVNRDPPPRPRVGASSAFKESTSRNPKIFIPKIPPVGSNISPPINLGELARSLVGNRVDEFGNILNGSSHALGRVQGDLPSMVGQTVTDTGQFFDAEGNVVGYVTDNYALSAAQDSQPLEGVAGPGLRVDQSGNIVDKTGAVVGRMKNNLADGASSSKSPPSMGTSSSSLPPKPNPSSEKDEVASGNPKPSATPSPSEIYLDVKSTNDGIQIIIKIPTIFNRSPPVVQIVNQ